MLFGQHFRDGEPPRNLNHVSLTQFENGFNKKIGMFMFKNQNDGATLMSRGVKQPSCLRAIATCSNMTYKEGVPPGKQSLITQRTWTRAFLLAYFVITCFKLTRFSDEIHNCGFRPKIWSAVRLAVTKHASGLP